VLLVDDYPDAREMYRVPRVLAFDVVEAENAWKPPARRDTTPDIIPMDLSLPVMDG
jgi:CheY-like chemotaxis protein